MNKEKSEVMNNSSCQLRIYCILLLIKNNAVFVLTHLPVIPGEVKLDSNKCKLCKNFFE